MTLKNHSFNGIKIKERWEINIQQAIGLLTQILEKSKCLHPTPYAIQPHLFYNPS